MRLTNDRVKNTRFVYRSCPKGHGPATTFYNVLAEKQFVPLTQQERAKLAASVQQISVPAARRRSTSARPMPANTAARRSVFDREAAKKAIDHYLQERQNRCRRSIAQSPGYGYSTSSPGWLEHGTPPISLLTSVCARASCRARSATPAAAWYQRPPVVPAGNMLADTGTVATGGLLESIGSAHPRWAMLIGALPTATDPCSATP